MSSRSFSSSQIQWATNSGLAVGVGLGGSTESSMPRAHDISGTRNRGTDADRWFVWLSPSLGCVKILIAISFGLVVVLGGDRDLGAAPRGRLSHLFCASIKATRAIVQKERSDALGDGFVLARACSGTWAGSSFRLASAGGPQRQRGEVGLTRVPSAPQALLLRELFLRVDLSHKAIQEALASRGGTSSRIICLCPRPVCGHSGV